MHDKKRLMIVDDSAIMVKLIQKHVYDLNIDVVGTAGDGKKALEVFNKTKPDIVTLDITMPEIDGLTVLDKMIEINPAVKVVVITALNDKETGLKAIKRGAKGFIGKPFTEERIRGIIEKFCHDN